MPPMTSQTKSKGFLPPRRLPSDPVPSGDATSQEPAASADDDDPPAFSQSFFDEDELAGSLPSSQTMKRIIEAVESSMDQVVDNMAASKGSKKGPKSTKKSSKTKVDPMDKMATSEGPPKGPKSTKKSSKDSKRTSSTIKAKSNDDGKRTFHKKTKATGSDGAKKKEKKRAAPKRPQPPRKKRRLTAVDEFFPEPETHHLRLAKALKTEEEFGTWVQCQQCNRWRFLADVKDPLLVPKQWFCSMNPDANFNSCNKEEESLGDDDQSKSVECRYTVGSVVWAKLSGGFPWWPGFVDDELFNLEFFMDDVEGNEPSYYHVRFFDYVRDEVGSAWIKRTNIMKFNRGLVPVVTSKISKGEMEKREKAIKAARTAKKMGAVEFSRRYGLLSRFRGKITIAEE